MIFRMRLIPGSVPTFLALCSVSRSLPIYGGSLVGPTPLLFMDHGKVVSELLSAEGVKQGDVLASLLFALSMKDIYADSVQDLECRAVAVMDDIYYYGPTAPTFNAFGRFASSLETRDTGLKINFSKSSFDS